MRGSNNIYIAVVDDDESLCRSFSRFLRANRFQPITYPSAEAFLDDNKHPKFDCLVLDVQLSGISGIELRRRLAAGGDSTPVIFITAQDDPAAQEQAEASGCAGFFSKSQSGADVLAAIRRAIGIDEPDDAFEATVPTDLSQPIKSNP